MKKSVPSDRPVSGFPVIPSLQDSGLELSVRGGTVRDDLDTVIDQLHRSNDALKALGAWKKENFDRPDLIAAFEAFLDAGGDPHWDDTRPFRGSAELKNWGGRLKGMLDSVNAAIQSLRKDTHDSLMLSLKVLGATLGSTLAQSGEPLYSSVIRAYEQGSQIRREKIDGLTLIFGAYSGREDDSPFRNSLAKALGVVPARIIEEVKAAGAAIEALAEAEVGLRIIPPPTDQAHERLLALGFADAATYRPFVERRVLQMREAMENAMQPPEPDL